MRLDRRARQRRGSNLLSLGSLARTSLSNLNLPHLTDLSADARTFTTPGPCNLGFFDLSAHRVLTSAGHTSIWLLALSP